uniref:Biotin carboxyl carrier protein of acetyl-CoA carboxylase n=1 Tax=Cajanus cajan TaxID=3821 RepID=A0A151TAV4_CAJCA|nr:hypothetical protein KK1_018772 [Cajanus cajan]
MASSFAPGTTKAATNLCLTHSSRLSPKPNNLRFHTPNKPGHVLLCPRVKAQLKEVSLDGSSNAPPPNKEKSDKEPPMKPSAESSSSVLATQESVSQFINQVASLVKLVDSRDIMELKMQQHDVEITIRKKEAMPQLQPAVVYSTPPPAMPLPPVESASPPTSALARPSPTPASPPAVKSTKSSHPPLKSPMAGTFYRSPAPGEPPFVKVGDKVKKGQVVCIIEAMKLMNEIEVSSKVLYSFY